MSKAVSYINLNALTPSGTGVSRAFAVNNNGVVARAYAASTATSSSDYTYFTYANGVITPYPTAGGARLTYDATLANGGRLLAESGRFAAGQGFSSSNAGETVVLTPASTIRPPARTSQRRSAPPTPPAPTRSASTSPP